MKSLLRQINARGRRSAFKRSHRIDFYRAMYLYQRAGISKAESLQQLTDTYETYLTPWQRAGNWLYTLLGGQGKPFRPVIAAVSRSGLNNLSQPLAQALDDWLPLAERAIIAAGERAGQLAPAFERAGRFAKQQGGMWSKVLTASAYPVGMTLVIMGMLYMFGGSLLPGLNVTSTASFSKSTQVLVWLAYATYDYWYIALLMVAMVVVAVFASLGRWKGSWRTKADRYPPWSLYRRIHGALFLYTFAVLQRSGVSILGALNILSQDANPWLRTRISGAMLGVRQGYNLGRSLRNAGHDFPAWDALPVIESIGAQSGSAEALTEYAENWLEDTSRQIDVFSRGVTAFGLAWVTLWTLWLALSFMDIIFISFR